MIIDSSRNASISTIWPCLITGESWIWKGKFFEDHPFFDASKTWKFIQSIVELSKKALIDSEAFWPWGKVLLLGHMKPVKDIFEVTDGGSIFWMEIGELPSWHSSFVLTTSIEKGEFIPSRISKVLKINVRVNTCNELSICFQSCWKRKIQRGSFTIRLNTVPISFPTHFVSEEKTVVLLFRKIHFWFFLKNNHVKAYYAWIGKRKSINALFFSGKTSAALKSLQSKSLFWKR